jgi:DNA-binding SARP family transcriptional activator
MEEHIANPARLYLPLLVNPQHNIRQHASMILLGTYGERALTYVRRLLEDPDQQVRQQARQALRNLGDSIGIKVGLQPAPAMYVECLGHLRVYIGNREIQPQDWAQLEGGRAGWRKVQGVFAYLIHCGRRGTSREELGAAVWGGPVSASSLSRTLTALRQVLGHTEDSTFVERALSITRDGCVLSPDLYHTDVQLFERVFNIASYTEQANGLPAAVPLYSQALSLYSGSYMADVPSSVTWSQERHDLLMNAFVIAAERLAECAYTQRRYRQCIALCRQALHVDPVADDVTAWRLRACARLGLYGELERVYRGYLRASAVDLQSAEAQQDIVIQTYQGLKRARAVGA